jgi:hypothetical protein
MALSTRSTTRPTVGVTRARQGRLGRHVLWILLAAMLLVVLGFLATWTWKSGDLASVEPNNGKEQVDARAFDAPQPAAVGRENENKAAPLAGPMGGPPK